MKHTLIWACVALAIGGVAAWRGMTPRPVADAVTACNNACRPHAFAHGSMARFSIDHGNVLCECRP